MLIHLTQYPRQSSELPCLSPKSDPAQRWHHIHIVSRTRDLTDCICMKQCRLLPMWLQRHQLGMNECCKVKSHHLNGSLFLFCLSQGKRNLSGTEAVEWKGSNNDSKPEATIGRLNLNKHNQVRQGFSLRSWSLYIEPVNTFTFIFLCKTHNSWSLPEP